jgi:hypothetical protein
VGFVLLWLMMGGVVAVIANSKGFDTFGWFIYGAIIWPIALAHVIVKPAFAQKTRTSISSVEGSESPTKTCPECAETIKEAAVVCRFCGNRAFPDQTDVTGEDSFLDSLAPYTPKLQPTTWQKLWWNPHVPDRNR